MKFKIGDKVRIVNGEGWGWSICSPSQSYGIVKDICNGGELIGLFIYMNNEIDHPAFKNECVFHFLSSTIKKE